MNIIQFLLTVLLASSSSLLLAQPTSVSAVFDSLNHRVLTTKKGYYQTYYTWKTAPKEDTSFYQAEIYFFRDSNKALNTACFVVKRDNDTWQAYDGEKGYTKYNNKPKVRVDTIGKDGAILYKGNSGGDIIFLPLLYNKQNIFPLEKHDTSSLKIIENQGEKTIYITLEDTFVNTYRINPKDPVIGSRKVIYEISYPDYQLKQHTDWFYFMTTPIYRNTIISPIQPLLDSIKFEKIFNLDSLLQAGYTLTDRETESNAQRQKEVQLIEVGATLPDFGIVNLDGDTVKLNGLNKGVLLLDFWYQSCYPCLQALPAIEQLYQKQQQYNLMVLGVNPFDRDPAKIKRFLKDRDISYPSLLDTDKLYVQKLGIKGYPTMLLVDAATKKVLYVQEGFSERVEKKLIELLNAYKD